MKQVMVLEKTTKGAYLYSVPEGDRNDAHPLWSIYVRKSGIQGQPPAKAVISFEAADEGNA